MRLKTMCGATRDIEVNDAPRQSPIDVPMHVGSRRGITFAASDSMPSLGDPPKIVTRTFEYYAQGFGELPIYRERYAGPSPDQQSYERIVKAQNREIDQLKAHVRALEQRLLPRVLRWLGVEA